MSGFRYKNQYVPGNTDPFAKINSGSGSESGSSKGGNSSGSSGGSDGSSEQAKQEAAEKSTNSNGGTPNPASTGK